MKWIKCSDRLPEGKVPMKYDTEYGSMEVLEEGVKVCNGGVCVLYDFRDRGLYDLEWLDEKEEPAALPEWIIRLLIKERKRAVDIAYEFMSSNKERYESMKSAGSKVAFVKEDIANECRLVGNAISGLTGLSHPLNETLETELRKEYAALSATKGEEQGDNIHPAFKDIIKTINPNK